MSHPPNPLTDESDALWFLVAVLALAALGTVLVAWGLYSLVRYLF